MTLQIPRLPLAQSLLVIADACCVNANCEAWATTDTDRQKSQANEPRSFAAHVMWPSQSTDGQTAVGGTGRSLWSTGGERMRVEISVPQYSTDNGLVVDWEPEPVIRVTHQQDGMYVQANRDGCVTLARIFLSLAQRGVPNGVHLHLESSNGLTDDSSPWTIELQSPDVR
jgi:hypothetical protein